MKKTYSEIGFGNNSFLSTEVEDGKNECRVSKFLIPKKILGIYFRVWILNKVVIVSSLEGIKLQRRDKSKFKLLFGIDGMIK
mgnify:CR=1 FL=1